MGMDVSDFRRLERLSVQVNPPSDGNQPAYFLLALAAAADSIVPWGANFMLRDKQLRDFYITEPWLASTVASLSGRNAAFSWTLEGPPRTCDRIQDALHASNYGGGWTDLLSKLSTDLYTQDNGAFIEVIRDGKGPSAPFIGLANLDSGRCRRTGNWEYPVIYADREGAEHKLAWYQVLDFTDAPSPIESANGVGLCAVSRALRYAQIMRDIAIYHWEKVSGRNPGALHIVSGVSTKMLQDTLTSAASNVDNKGNSRYEQPAVLGTLDPSATVSLQTILLKSLPDNYDPENDRKWYIAALALAFGAEYQDLAPLPGGGLGTSQQSTILHLKAKGKGPELFQKMLTHKLNFYVLPRQIQFKFDEKDFETGQIEAGVKKTRGETRALRIASGELTPQVARQIAEDEGDLKHEYLELMATEDVTPDEQVTDEAVEQEPLPVQAEPAISPPPPTGAVPAGPPPAGQQPGQMPPQFKQLDADELERRRVRWEREYETEMAAILEDVQARVIASVKREVAAEEQLSAGR